MKAGTTQAEWDEYNKRVEAHELFIEKYKFFLNRIVNHLAFLGKDKVWTPEEIRETISNEIRKSHSMDAPNEPGYYRANND